MSYDIVFATDKFNLSEPQDYFISRRSFGDDVADWLCEKLDEQGIGISEPMQEDWGWYIEIEHEDIAYTLGISGENEYINNPEAAAEAAIIAEMEAQMRATGGEAPKEMGDIKSPNFGEWRVTLLKHRTAWEKFRGKNEMADDEAILFIVTRVISDEPGIRLLMVERHSKKDDE